MRSASIHRADMARVAIASMALSVAELRRTAAQVPNAKQARRILAIAMVLDAFSHQVWRIYEAVLDAWNTLIKISDLIR